MKANTNVGAEFEVIRLLALHCNSDLGLALRDCRDFMSYAAVCQAWEGFADRPSADVARDLLLLSYLRKWTGYAHPDRDSLTRDAWEDAERQCFRTNERLSRIQAGSKIDGFCERVRARIARILGPIPESLTRSGRWSNGATFSTRRGTHYSLKVCSDKSVTLPAAKHVPWFFTGLVAEDCNDFTVVEGNRCVQVPKTWKIDRMISAEPAANAFMQQAVGRHIRERLKRFTRVDLNDQTNNQRGAFHALVDGLATLDLSMASDTMATSLVNVLLPSDWFVFLDSLRSHKSRTVDGQWRYLDKFSSMGNAFTFELETLLFYSLCYEVDPDYEPLVYGDDIIVRDSAYEDVTQCLRFFGFTVNLDKSFTRGSRFFESCGKCYYDLEDVTPVYQKECISGDLAVIRAHNRLYRWGMRTGQFKVVRKALAYLKTLATPRARSCQIPLCERDDGFITHPSLLKRDRNGDFKCDVLYQPQLVRHSGVREDACYRMKLHTPGVLCEDPKGYPARLVSSPRPVKRRARIWLSSCELI